VLARAATQASYDPLPMGVSWDAWEPAWAMALARGASGHLAAYEIGIGPDAYLTLALIDAASLGVDVFNAVACASAPFTADAVPTKGGFLVATAAGSPFGDCPLNSGIPGPASELQVMR